MEAAVTDSERGQVAADAAKVYDDFFVPALFRQWAIRVAAAAEITAGQRVLDVASGTGVLARTVAELVGPAGSVVGLDVNAPMLAVAERAAPELEWRTGRAEALPFGDADFDAVVSQFGLMFFEDRGAAVGEMHRVLRAKGRVALAVWAAIDESPGYAALADLLADLFGESAAQSLRAPFAMGDPDAIVALLRNAGFRNPRVSTQCGTASFPSMESWMFTEIRGWTLAGSLDDADFGQLVAQANGQLARFEQPDGTVRFDIAALVATATK
jgi:ubiquinone/menaquinone biosynthesis C-methylase UbiE